MGFQHEDIQMPSGRQGCKLSASAIGSLLQSLVKGSVLPPVNTLWHLKHSYFPAFQLWTLPSSAKLTHEGSLQSPTSPETLSSISYREVLNREQLCKPRIIFVAALAPVLDILHSREEWEAPRSVLRTPRPEKKGMEEELQEMELEFPCSLWRGPHWTRYLHFRPWRSSGQSRSSSEGLHPSSRLN